MRERQLRKIMKARYPVVIRVPKCTRMALEKGGAVLVENIEGCIVDILIVGPRKQCEVVICDGLGRYIKVKASSVLRFKTLGDENGVDSMKRIVSRPKVKKELKEQKRLFN